MPSARARLTGSTLCFVLSAAIAAAAMTGCGERRGGFRARLVARSLQHQVPIQGEPITAGRFTAIDVENPNGSVRILVNDRYHEATVEFRVRDARRMARYARRAGLDFDPHAQWFTAVHEGHGQTAILRVTSNGAMFDGVRIAVDITIRTPSADGILVRNNNGNVTLVGVRGGIEVDSGFGGGIGGRIEVRTNHPLNDPINLASTGGHVVLVAAPGSSGMIEITSADGQATFRSKFGDTDSVRPRIGRWSGVWNKGQNDVRLHTDSGDAVVMVVANPEQYSVGG